MSAPLVVAVSGLHLGENAQPGPGIIRSLREAFGSRIRVVGLAYDAFDSALYAPGLLDDAYLVPYPSVGPEAYLARLLEIHAECRIDLVIPCLDVELPLLDRLAGELERAGIRCYLPTREALMARRKARLPELGHTASVAVPETRVVTDRGALSDAASALGYPLVIKALFYESEVARGPDEAESAFARLSAVWGLPLLAQRFITGEEYDVAAVGDGTGDVLGAVAMRKTIITRLGKAWGAMTVDDPAILAVARRVIQSLRWRGPCEVELLQDRSGMIHLIEVNPRFPAWIYLSAAAGNNLPERLVQLALGQRPARADVYRTGVFYVRHAIEAIGTVADLDEIYSHGRRSTAPPASGSEPPVVLPPPPAIPVDMLRI
ncbi:MAG: ATP-grasp domain-containing protein [Polyangiaceae bacterium]|nr:ATP-grasp domain-containing protein [Polyangiaceae bacterium]